jgi:hypothetical protein
MQILKLTDSIDSRKSVNAVAPRGERTPEITSAIIQVFLLPLGRRTG